MSNYSDPDPVQKQLSPEGCLDLFSILKSFCTQLNEDHAWGICYQFSSAILNILKNSEENPPGSYHLVDIDHLFIHKDGYIHHDSFHQDHHQKKVLNEWEFVFNLGEIILEALNFGLPVEEERNLSEDLDNLVKSMGDAKENEVSRSDEDDEGFEASAVDSDPDSSMLTLQKIIKICTKKLGSSYTSGSENADLYYKDICKALVSESIDLTTFLQKISQGPKELSKYNGNYEHADLDQLNLNDWARTWIQVVGQMRNGVKLNKVLDMRNTTVEYTLTPYEILMDRIKWKKYQLKSIMVDGDLPPRVKKTAGALILDFIRSRPSLKNAQDRILKPKPQQKPHPIELLMEDIRKEHSPRLKPPVKVNVAVKAQSVDHNQNLIITNKRRPIIPLPSDRDMTDSNMDQNQPQRRLIKADLDLLNSLDSKDYESEDDDDDEDDDYSQQFYINLPEGSQSSPVTPLRRPDIAFSSIKNIKGLNLRRRHSVANPSNRGEHSSTMITFPFEYTTLSTYKSLNYPKVSPILHRRTIPHSMSKSAIQEEFFQSNQWQTAIQCLSLNLEEVVHIRNVLTKAELESLPVECSLKDDVEKGKVCFLCMKTRFNLFCWGNACKLCKQIICSKCCQKMRIPLEHFAKIPVSSLSPILSPTVEEKEFPGSHHHQNHQEVKNLENLSPSPRLDSLGNHSSGVGSSSNRASSAGDSNSERSNSPACLHDLDDEATDHFPTTTNNGPINLKKSQSFRNTNNGPLSLPSISSLSKGFISFQKKRADIRPLMVVCHDCRIMVLEIKRAAKEGHSLPPGIGKVLQNANLGFDPSSLPTNVNNNVDLDMSFN